MKIEADQAEVRMVESNTLEQQLQSDENLLKEAEELGKMQVAYRAVALFNIREKKTYKATHKTFEEYVESRGVKRRTAFRYLSQAEKLFKLIPSATEVDGHVFVFNKNKAKTEIKKLMASNPDKSLAQIIAESQQLANYLNDDNSGIANDEAFSIITSNAKTPATTPEEQADASTPPTAHYNPDLKKYAEEHGLKYDKIRGWINNDDSDLTDKQRAEMTSYEAAMKMPETIALNMARFLKEFQQVIEKDAENYRLYLSRDNKKFSESAAQYFRGAQLAELRLQIALEATEFGELDKAIKALTATPEEVLEMKD
jgi:hypothetical protein